jgi:hypothetical protein
VWAEAFERFMRIVRISCVSRRRSNRYPFAPWLRNMVALTITVICCDFLDITEDTDMGFLSRFFSKRAEPSCEEADELLAVSLRALQGDLFADLSNIYSSQMDVEVARTLAAQVVNFLKGEDIDEHHIIAHFEEPLRSRIMAILPQVRQRAAEYMQADRQTREIIVATLRMTTVQNFWKYGEGWVQDPAQMRIERLLVQYGPEFPKEITPAAYAQMFAAYHAVKRTAWAAR